jgi:hypothetical protein
LRTTKPVFSFCHLHPSNSPLSQNEVSESYLL